MEMEKLNGGVFTHYLLRGLSGEARNKDGNVSLAALAQFVQNQVRLETQDNQRPVFGALPANLDPIIVKSRS